MDPIAKSNFPPPVSSFQTRAWFSGRTSPCQGEDREFDSRRPLIFSNIRPIGSREFESRRMTGTILVARSTFSLSFREVQSQKSKGVLTLKKTKWKLGPKKLTPPRRKKARGARKELMQNPRQFLQKKNPKNIGK